MSASREKQNRQDLMNSGWTDPKAAAEAEQAKKNKRNNILYAVIAVLFVIAIVISFVWRSNVIQKNSTAATIDGVEYTAAEVNFYYQNTYSGFMNTYYYLFSYMGIDTSVSLKNQPMNDTAALMLNVDSGSTWYDYLLEQALNEMAAMQNARKLAEEEGFVYPPEVQQQYDDAIASLNSLAKSSNLSVDAYLTNMFGSYMSADVYQEQLLNTLQYEAYVTAHNESLSYTLDELEAAYALDPVTYDSVSYEYLAISGAAESTTDADGNVVAATEEEEAAALEAAKKTAEELLAKYEDGTAMALLADEDAGITYYESDSSAYTGDAVSVWLFSTDREDGDCEIVEAGTTYYVVKFHERFREDYETINIRHVLIQPASGTLSAGDDGYEAEQEDLKAAAKAMAEDLLAEWKAGEATEESFAQMAMNYSSDSSSVDGGLYSRVSQGQMVTEFNDWCFDSSRKAGDTGIVETVYGYHIMYFSGKDLPYWQALVTEDLSTEDTYAFIDSLASGSEIERHNFGMKFVG